MFNVLSKYPPGCIFTGTRAGRRQHAACNAGNVRLHSNEWVYHYGVLLGP